MRRTVVVCSDDLTGEEGEDVSTYSFAWEGVTYEIDLSPGNEQQLADALAPFIEKARRITLRGPQPRLRGSSGMDSAQLQDIREWAEVNGYRASARGRIPQPTLNAYQEAHALAKAAS